MNLLRTSLRVLLLACGRLRRRPALAFAQLAIALAATGSLVYTTSHTRARNVRLAAELSDPMARSMVIRSGNGTGLDPAASAWLATLPGVIEAAAFTEIASARSSRVPYQPQAIAAFDLTVLRGDPPVAILTGRVPGPSQATISVEGSEALGIQAPLSAAVRIDTLDYGIVGTYAVMAHGKAAAFLRGSAIFEGRNRAPGYQAVVLTVRTPADLEMVAGAVPILYGFGKPGDYSIEFDSSLAKTTAELSKTSKSSVRGIALALLATGSAMELVIVVVNAIIQRRVIARRRALGATRSSVVALLSAETALTAGLGGTLGVAVAAALLGRSDDHLDVRSALCVAFIVWLAAVAVALPAALLGAVQDPAKILRVP